MSPDVAQARRGLWLGLLAVLLFSLTLPATRAALTGFSPWFIAAGRAALAAMLALAVLRIARARTPDVTEFRQLLLVALGVVFGFPYFTTWAMQQVPANHGAVVLALLPLATALAATIVAHERPSAQFWAWAVLGAALAVGFALREGGGSWQVADLALLAAILSAAGGYALGAEVSRKLGGWQTISWALVISLPVNLLVAAAHWPAAEGSASALPGIGSGGSGGIHAWFVSGLHGIQEAGPLAWGGFLYVAFISMYLGFFPWYRALALGGIARVGQIQLLQPFMTFAGAALWMGESLDAGTLAFALIIAGVVALGRRAPVAHRAPAS